MDCRPFELFYQVCCWCIIVPVEGCIENVPMRCLGSIKSARACQCPFVPVDPPLPTIVPAPLGGIIKLSSIVQKVLLPTEEQCNYSSCKESHQMILNHLHIKCYMKEKDKMQELYHEGPCIEFLAVVLHSHALSNSYFPLSSTC